MATEVLAAGVGEVRALSTAGGGTALTTTAGYIVIPPNTHHLYITPRNFATGVVAQIALNPYLVILKSTDAMATTPTDYSANAQDGLSATLVTMSSLSTLANGDYLLIGAHLPFRGVYVNVTSTNSNASVLTVHYYNTSAAWADTSATDGTDNGGATFGQDGLVVWTVPTAWDCVKLKDIYTSCPVVSTYNVPLYWTRWSVSAALDSSTTAEAMLCANRSTAYMELLSGQTFEQRVFAGVGGFGCVEAKMNAGTGNLVVNGASARSGGF